MQGPQLNMAMESLNYYKFILKIILHDLIDAKIGERVNGGWIFNEMEKKRGRQPGFDHIRNK